MSKTLYVGNLEWGSTDEELRELFAAFGEVSSAQVIKDKETGRSRGFGFVNMENADQAMAELNGKDFRGRPLKVNEATEKPARRDSGSSGSGSYGPQGGQQPSNPAYFAPPQGGEEVRRDSFGRRRRREEY